MSLNNTIILSEDNADEAKSAFDAALQNDKITILIYGNSEKAQQAAAIADQLAAIPTAGFNRQVIWIKNNTQWANLKSSVGNGTIQVSSIIPDQLICTSLTLSNKAEFCVEISKVPDNFVLTLAFTQASKA